MKAASFLGRKKELDQLNKLYQTDKFQMVMIYGRRRVGKTTLIREFCKGKKNIFFSAIQSNPADNLEELSKAIYACLLPENRTLLTGFKSVNDAFEYIARASTDERLIFIVDEYPYWTESDHSISSRIQQTIDQTFQNTKLFIILCGSSASFMKNQVLGCHSPFYDRRTAQFNILPFNYYETALFCPEYTLADKALVYGISGGVPLYIHQLTENDDLYESILSNLFMPNSLLFEEPGNLLKQELREPQMYNAIINAITDGRSKLSEISSGVGIETAICSKYLRNLISLGIVKKEEPVIGKTGRKTIYRISDNLFRFWYTFVQTNMSSIVSGRIIDEFESMVKKHIPEYMGLVFEQMCKEFLFFYYKNFHAGISQIGQWWGNNPEEKQEEQIDTIVLSSDRQQAIFCECKYRNEKTDIEILDRLIQKSSLISGFEKKDFFLFSKSGFTDRLRNRAKKERVILFELKDLYRIPLYS